MDTEHVVSFLESFFAQLECFDWSSATGVVRRFPSATYGGLCKVMAALVQCERIYYSMSFYSDNQLVHQYSQTKDQIEEFAQKQNYVEIFHTYLCHCSPLINARMNMLSIYYLLRDNEYTSPSVLSRSVTSFRQNPPICKLLNQSHCQDVEAQLSGLEEELLRNYYQINHWLAPTLFAQLKRNIMHELTILRMLLGTRRYIKEMNMKDTCFSIFQCKQELNIWASYFSTVELIKSQTLYKWFTRYFYFLLSKMSLYFHRAFSYQHNLRADSEDVSQLYCNRGQMRPHFINMITSFCSKVSIDHCSIIVDHNKISEEYGQWSLDGYEIPTEDTEEVRTGLSSWPSIFAFPVGSNMNSHLPNVLGVIEEGGNELALGNCVGYYDRKLKVTYIIRLIEKYIYMVIVTPAKRGDIKNMKLFAAHFVSSLSMLSPTIKT